FPVVQIVTFENGPCTAASGETGTCYSQKECSNEGGSASGTCANGFGVCCVLTATCDGKASVNGTYFTNPGYPGTYMVPGMCMLELIPPPGVSIEISQKTKLKPGSGTEERLSVAFVC
ncbi:hypothetical protein SK128_026521, partial [Halocaridina rubra]